MSNRPNKPLNELVDNFDIAMEGGNLDKLESAEKALDRVVHGRLRRLSHRGYPIRDLETLLESLPEDYSTKVVDKLFFILDKKDSESRLQQQY